MRVAIAGAGNVGRSIANELLDNGHHVMVIERDVLLTKHSLMTPFDEEAFTDDDLVRLRTFRQADTHLVEITLPETAPFVGRPVRDVPLPRDSALVAILRGKRVLVPSQDDPLEAGDELVFVCTTAVEDQVRAVVLGPDSVARTRGGGVD